MSGLYKLLELLNGEYVLGWAGLSLLLSKEVYPFLYKSYRAASALLGWLRRALGWGARAPAGSNTPGTRARRLAGYPPRRRGRPSDGELEESAL